MKTIIFSLVATLLLLSGCNPTETLVYVDRPFPVEVISIKTDSVMIYEKDSIMMFTKGDTIFRTQYSIRWREKIVERIDTVPRIVKETTYIDKPVEVVKIQKDWIWWVGLLSMFLFVIFATLRIKRIFAR